MIYNQWYIIYNAKKLRKNKPVGLRRLNEDLIIWRNNDNSIGCISDRCIHRGASLSLGKTAGDHIQCPFHGLEFDINGECKLIPGNGRQFKIPRNFHTKSYRAYEKHGFIWIFWGDKKEDIPEIPFFKDIDDSMACAMIENKWNMHYTRCIENQLDVLHLPFVHNTTIGKGNKTLVNGPRTEMSDNGFYVYVKNDFDNGQAPLRPEEMPAPIPGQFHLQFIFPNLWQNYISDKLRIFISFTPIDEENTILYLRMYQKIMVFPVLKKLVNFLMMKYNLIILNQDKRVVLTQLPKKSELKMGEQLVTGDMPIIKYRQIRQQMLERESLKDHNKID